MPREPCNHRIDEDIKVEFNIEQAAARHKKELHGQLSSKFEKRKYFDDVRREFEEATEKMKIIQPRRGKRGLSEQ